MLKRNVAVLLVAVLVLGVGAYAWAEGGPAGPSVTSATSPASPASSAPADGNATGLVRHRLRQLARHTYHGDLDVWVDGQTHEVTIDRGKLTSHDADSVTITDPTGATHEFAVTSDTKVRGAGENHELVDGRGTLVVSEGGVTKAVVQRVARQSTGEAGAAGAAA
jgi:hypothetical protein